MATSTTKSAKPATEPVDPKIQQERDKNARPGFFLRGAVWILSRFPGTKNKYQNWTASRRILVGWILWVVCLPIIPLVAIAVWYFNDPEGFKKSPWAKALVGLFVVWAGFFGFVATNQSQPDINGLYSAVQTEPDGEKGGSITAKPASAASEESKKKVANQTSSNPTNGRKFENCTAAFDAGVFNIKRSDSAYDSKLDRDDDGIACEK
jgi:hypothetical protein